jgi:membrane fusion protein, multidrug efflux system
MFRPPRFETLAFAMPPVGNRFRIWLMSLTLLTVFAFPPLIGAREDAPTETDVAVGVGTIARKTLHAYLTAYGAVEAEPAQGGKPPASAGVAATSAGLIVEAHCEEGQRVGRGQILFSLEHRLVDAQIEKAKTVLVLADKNLQRKRSLVATDNVSQKLLDEAEQQLGAAKQDLALAQAQRKLLQVESPLNGTVVRINTRPGEVVSGNAVLADVVDLDRLIVNAAVPGVEMPRLKRGQVAALSVSSDADKVTSAAPPAPHGSISFIGLQVDPKTATVPVRIALPAGSGLRPGQFVQARIVVEEHAGRLAVPLESVVTVDGQSTIFVVKGDRARRKPVRLGLREAGWAEVEGDDDLQEGTGVVTTGAYGLPGDTRIHALKP